MQTQTVLSSFDQVNECSNNFPHAESRRLSWSTWLITYQDSVPKSSHSSHY